IYMAQHGSQYFDSSIVQYTLTFKVAAPQITATLNSAGTQLTIVVSTATAGANIYYTTDGTDPTTSSTLYTGGSSGVSVAANLTTKWKAFHPTYNFASSETVTQLGVPSFVPPGGAYPGGQTITITAPANAQIQVLQENPNLLDFSTWVVGSHGSQTGFDQNGD